MPAKRTVSVTQWDNPRYIPQWLRTEPKYSEPLSEKNSAEYIYVVDNLKNSIRPVIGSTLLPSEVEALIEEGFEVNVRGDGK